MGVFGGFNPLFSSGSGTFLIELSESDESEYVISNVLSNVLVLNYLSFKALYIKKFSVYSKFR